VVTSDLEDVGGTEVYLKALGNALLKKDSVDVHILYLSRSGNVQERSQSHGDSTLTFHPFYVKDRRRKFSTMMGVGREMGRIISEVGIDVVHMHSPISPDAMTACIVPVLKGVPLVLTSHGDRGYQFSLNPLKTAGRTLGALMIELSEVKTGVSDVAARVLGRDAFNIGSICDLETFNPDAPDLNPDSFRRRVGVGDEKIILYPARIHPTKGQMDLLKATKELREKLGGGFKTVIVGPSNDDRYVEELRKYVSEHNLTDLVDILPPVDHKQLRHMYAAAHVVAFPSYHPEGLGLTAVESMAMRVPVVAYARGGIAEVVRDGENGILSKTGDLDGLIEGLVKVLGDDELARRLGGNGRRFVESEYSPDRLADRLMVLYGRLKKQRK
jgi:glycosyltransferase involved in cell wall biosynthesis